MIDFSKYNKGLRFLATLFNINPEVFDTETFIDIECNGKRLEIFYDKLYDEYIKKLLIENKYYHSNETKECKGKIYYVYIYEFIYDKNNSNVLLVSNTKIIKSNLLVTSIDYVKICIHWKKYLDNSFIELCYDDYYSFQLNEKALQ